MISASCSNKLFFMKKFLLTAVAAVLGITAYAETVYEKSFSEFETFPYYVMGYEPTIENGILKASYPGSWYQFFIADQIPTKAGETYTATVKIKASMAGSLPLNMGWGWGDGEQLKSSINVTTEWTEASTVFVGVDGTSSNLVLQPGSFEGDIEIEWVKVEDGAESVELPTTGTIVAEYYTANSDQTVSGWGGSATFENVEEDGKPCLKFTNPEAADGAWGVQMAFMSEFKAGTTYYLGFDIKGDAAKNIASQFQAAGEEDGSAYYEDKGSMSQFSITPEWNHVIVYGECTEGSNPEHKANRLLINLGKYVGTFYMTNVTIYTDGESGIKSVSSDAETVCQGVYNLQGIRVLESNDASAVKNLPKGIYVINGKKVVMK